MAQLTSPARGCRLRVVEVHVAGAVETYDSKQFSEPLELSLDGQRSLGSNCGVLLLAISTGSRKMLCIRLNDLLNHPNGSEGTIFIDKKTHQLCVKLPAHGHTLQIWFRENRDFLVCVCILRKAGFTIDEDLLPPQYEKGTREGAISSHKRSAASADLPRLSSITPLAALAAQAEAFCTESSTISPSNQTVKHTGKNVFDDVLDLLKMNTARSKSTLADETNLSSTLAESRDLSCLNPYNAFSSKRKDVLNQPQVGSPLRNVVGQGQSYHGDGKTHERKPFVTLQHPERRHDYFLRSFSGSDHRPRHHAHQDRASQPSTIRGDNGQFSKIADVNNASRGANASFDSSLTADFRNLLPQRRKLPFFDNRQQPQKKTKNDLDPTLISLHKAQQSSSTLENEMWRGSQVDDLPETAIMLTQPLILENLERESSPIFDQYEKDITQGCDAGQCAAFYLDRLHVLRRNFWHSELMKVYIPTGERIVGT
ncbi:hypothetical protein QQS21_012437 [Conoideocrella luteorostrata]|uniref:Uncharacterized protein n=1 Tax=Conoideocrella luteorostrata TaxID=1105319 RepID=A0AAJ0CB71_9HYPO|nr:hypothetical protein QQS21_012437 [Conoideocrella luteorostrata]